MKAPDENDKLRSGALPNDPWADTVPAVPAARVSQAEKRPATPEEQAAEDPFSGLAKAALRAPEAKPPTPPEAEGFDAWGGKSVAPALSHAALHGLAGDVVRAIEPHTEAHPMAVLGQFLATVGCMLGRGAHFAVGATRHYLNLFLALVGPSAKARKGTAWDEVALMLGRVDDTFMARVTNGLVSGEGLIELVRDAQYKELPDDKGNLVRQLVVDGVEDKRLLVQESELGRTVGQLGKEFNTLSAVLRDAWDGRRLASQGRHKPVESTGAHIGVIGHVTTFELLERLNQNDAVNGFSNRFLWLFVKRLKYLPSGGALPEEARRALVDRLRDVLDFARGVALMRRDPTAEACWERLYPALTADQPGLLGSVTGRAEPTTMRLACLYALLDRSAQVRVEHLRAAVGVWKYSFESSAVIFGEGLGDPVADELSRLLRDAGPGGLTKTQIHERFGRHQTRKVIAGGKLLLSAGLAKVERRPTAGRTAEALVWVGAPPMVENLAAFLAEPPPAPVGPTGAKEASEGTSASPAGAKEAKEALTLFRFDRAAPDAYRSGEL